MAARPACCVDCPPAWHSCGCMCPDCSPDFDCGECACEHSALRTLVLLVGEIADAVKQIQEDRT